MYVIAKSLDGRTTSGKHLKVKVDPVGKATNVKADKDGTITWTKAENAVKYQVVKIVNGKYYGGSYVSENKYKFANLPTVDYQVYVLSYGANGARTASDKASVKVENQLGFVNDVKVDKNGKVTWGKATNAAAYRVAKISNGITYYTKKITDTSYRFAVVPDHDYQVYVIAYDDNDRYTLGKRTTVEVGTLGTVTDPKVDKNGRVSWTGVRNAAYYKVAMKIGSKTYYSGEVHGTSYTIHTPAKYSYKVFIVAYDKDGNKTWGNQVNVTVK